MFTNEQMSGRSDRELDHYAHQDDIVLLENQRKGERALFAGRIGGNQRFVASPDTAEGRKIVANIPDAAPLTSLKDVLNLTGFVQPILWKAAVVECWGTAMLVFVVGMVGNASAEYSTPTSLQAPVVAGLMNWLGLALLIFAAGPTSGGHLNPFITMSTFAAGLSTLSRSLLYILAQMIGAVVGASLLRGGVGEDRYFASGVIAGCSIDAGRISYGEAFVLELGSNLALIMIAFGVGLDPRQSQVLGPSLSPILVGLAVGSISLATGFTNTGWAGAYPALNPARCFGLMAAKTEFGGHWLHWIAAICAAGLNGLLYHFNPPHSS